MSEPTTPRITRNGHCKQQRYTNLCTKSDGTIDATTDKSRKFFTTWRSACDKTKDKTKELLKRTLSWKGQDYSDNEFEACGEDFTKTTHPGWSVHIWTTLVRNPSTRNELDTLPPITLSSIQREKLSHFFYHLLDIDHDDLICAQDFESLSDRLRHFAKWSIKSTEFSVLKQIQQEFAKTFIPSPDLPIVPASGYIEFDDWLRTWSSLLRCVRKINELPFWLRELPKVFFLVINRSGSGILKPEELKAFFISVVGMHNMKDDEVESMLKSWTANGDFELKYSIYELCFVNWLLCQNPNGPGQWLFGKCGSRPEYFPIDYSAMNSSIEDREPYTPDLKSNRHSVIV